MRVWPRRLGIAALLLGCAGLLAEFSYQLYVAWKYRLVVWGRRDSALYNTRRWTSLEDSPVWFWWTVGTDVLLVLLFLGLFLFLLVAWRRVATEEYRLRRRETRPPMEDAIRQDVAER